MTIYLITPVNKKTRSTKSKKWRHERTSIEIALANEKKSRIEVVVTSFGRNNSLDEKKQEKANNSPSYRCAAIKKHWINYFKLFKTWPSLLAPSKILSKNFLCTFFMEALDVIFSLILARRLLQNGMTCATKERAKILLFFSSKQFVTH